MFRPVDANHRVRIKSLERTNFKSSVSPSIPSSASGVTFGYPKIISKIDRVSMNRPYSTLSFVFIGKRHAGFFVYTFYSVLFIVRVCESSTLLTYDLKHLSTGTIMQCNDFCSTL